MRVLLLSLLLAACSQASADAPAEPDLQTGPTPLAPEALVEADTSMSDAEARVLELVQTEGIHVVHFWAPWCGNSMNELRSGLYETIEEHPDVTFTFVTVRNNGDDGSETLARFGIPERVEVLAHPGGKPVIFLGRPITWTPTTWVFNRGGDLAYAFNYGEVSPAMLTQAIADASSEWHHD